MLWKWADRLVQYAKLPDDIAQRYILLLDPMLGKIIYIFHSEMLQLTMISSHWRFVYQGHRSSSWPWCSRGEDTLFELGAWLLSSLRAIFWRKIDCFARGHQKSLHSLPQAHYCTGVFSWSECHSWFHIDYCLGWRGPWWPFIHCSWSWWLRRQVGAMLSLWCTLAYMLMLHRHRYFL